MAVWVVGFGGEVVFGLELVVVSGEVCWEVGGGGGGEVVDY